MFHTRIMTALSEGSTWAAIGGAFGTLGTQLPPPFSYYAYVGAGVAAIVAVVLKDKGAG